MPYTTPSTVTGSDVLTAALWNTQIRDNLEWLRKPQLACVYLQGTQPALAAGSTISWNAALYDTSTTPVTWSVGDPTKLYFRDAGVYDVTFNGRITTSVAQTPPATPSVSLFRTLVGQNFLTVRSIATTDYSNFLASFSIKVLVGAGESISVNTGATTGTVTLGSASGSAGSSQFSGTTRLAVTWLGPA